MCITTSLASAHISKFLVYDTVSWGSGELHTIKWTGMKHNKSLDGIPAAANGTFQRSNESRAQALDGRPIRVYKKENKALVFGDCEKSSYIPHWQINCQQCGNRWISTRDRRTPSHVSASSSLRSSGLNAKVIHVSLNMPIPSHKLEGGVQQKHVGNASELPCWQA